MFFTFSQIHIKPFVELGPEFRKESNISIEDDSY